MLRQIALLVRLYAQPARAMSEILDRGSLLFASLAVLAVTLFLESSLAAAGLLFPFRFYMPLLVLAAVYVPGMLLITNLIARLGGMGTVFERDYSPLLTATAMAWAAMNLPFAILVRLVPAAALGAVFLLALAYFALLMFFAVRTVFGTGNGMAAGAVALSWIPLAVALFFWGPLSIILGWLASPFFLLLAWFYLGAEFAKLGSGMRDRQRFRRMLDAAALNPHDADAQYQLGLIYQQRRDYAEAVKHFDRAVAIDPREVDAHFQLGRIARTEGRLNDALARFQAVLDIDDTHSQGEILREIGAMYLDARQYEDARRELAAYIERRPYDPEGLCYWGQALEGAGDRAGALAAYQRAIEAARTAPRYRRREVAKWSRLAHKQARKIRAQAPG
jgi:tetratricopeptide (TPR) repeat protein